MAWPSPVRRVGNKWREPSASPPYTAAAGRDGQQQQVVCRKSRGAGAGGWRAAAAPPGSQHTGPAVREPAQGAWAAQGPWPALLAQQHHSCYSFFLLPPVFVLTRTWPPAGARQGLP